MTTDLDIRHPSTALAIRPGQEMWNDKQRAALAVLGIKNATNADLAVFMHYCQKTGLDPFSRQIYMICRREKQDGGWVDKQTIQVGIDGFRVIRDRIAQRLGLSVEYEDTIWYDAYGQEAGVWLSDEPPAACKVVVVKDGKRFPAVVRTAAYAATNKDGQLVAQWRTQPEHMIEKCAEAFALRRAFPHDLGGMYIDEEMTAAPAPAPVQPGRVTVAEVVREQHPAEDPTPAPGAPATAPTAHPAPDAPGAANASQTATGRPATSSQPDASHVQPAGKVSLDRLAAVWQRIGITDDTEQADIIRWTEPQWTASRKQVTDLTAWLADWLEAAKGDPEEARSQLWTRYHQANPAASDGP